MIPGDYWVDCCFILSARMIGTLRQSVAPSGSVRWDGPGLSTQVVESPGPCFNSLQRFGPVPSLAWMRPTTGPHADGPVEFRVHP